MGHAPQLVLVGQEVVEGGPVRRVHRHGERAGLVKADVEPGVVLEARGEVLPEGDAGQEEGGEGRLTELRLGDRGQHPGRHPGGAVPARKRGRPG